MFAGLRCQLLHARVQALHHRRSRWLGNQYDDLGRGIRCQHFHGGMQADAADGCARIAPAGAQRVRHTLAQRVDLAADFLQTRAGGTHQAYATTSHLVGKTQRYPTDDGSAAIRPHHQPAMGLGQLLDGQLLFQRNIVRKQEYIQTGLDRLERLGRRIRTGYRNLCQACVVTSLVRSGNCHRHRLWRHLLHAGLACCRLARKQSLGQLQRRSDTTAVMVVGVLHQHHQIGGTRCAQSIAE